VTQLLQGEKKGLHRISGLFLQLTLLTGDIHLSASQYLVMLEPKAVLISCTYL